MKKLLLCLLLCACQIANEQSIVNQPEEPKTELSTFQDLPECAKTDKGSILWYDHFSNDVIGLATDKYDMRRRICANTKIYNRKEVSHPVFLYYTYKQDMSEKCKRAISGFIDELNNRVCI